jgi:hypothetical protein
MKKVVLNALIALFSPFYFCACPADTTIKGIEVSFTYTKEIFPESWQPAPVNARGETIAFSEISRSGAAAVKALNKYPENVLTHNLKAVYFLKSLSFFGVGYGATNSNDVVYIASNGVAKGYTDFYLEKSFIMSFPVFFSGITPRSSIPLSGKKQMEMVLIIMIRKMGWVPFRNKKSSEELDTALARIGMLTQYAMSSLENDINTIAQNLFLPDNNFWDITDHYPLIKKKVKLAYCFL